ncbi:MAG: VTT domain-containing protein [Desulfobacterales bacterium]
MMKTEPKSIMKEGRNCWRNSQAGRIALLVDGAAYFEALVEAVEQAQKTIYIAGWDFDSRISLSRRSGDSVSLGEFLNQTVSHTRDLRVYVLVWDWAMIYVTERQWLPILTLPWKRHPRISFQMDEKHPIGASQHQKVVVIDDAVAFCGGIDLSKNRWDTPEHQPQDPHRKTPEGDEYGPFHDAQIMVDGDAAASLGDLFRDRWRWATGKMLPAQESPHHPPWPSSIEPDLTDASVGISRTLPAYKGREEVREIQQLYQDGIAAAEKLIYIENQYLTAGDIAGLLVERLRQENGPEIVVVLPRNSSGWLEKSTMDAIRNQIVNRLHEVDRHNRLAIVYPAIGNRSVPIYVHAKILVIDNRLMTVGSANLSNRSMGLDSECNLVVESNGGGRIADAIDRMHCRLLAEHLGVSIERLSTTLDETDSLLKTIDSLGGSKRSLMKLEINREPPIDGADVVPERDLLDPEEPVKFDQMMDLFVYTEDEENQTGKRQWVKLIVVLALLLALAASWRWTPLSELIDIERLGGWVNAMKGSLLVPAVVMGIYVVGGMLMIPVTLMVGATGIVFSPLIGTLYALAGCLLSGLTAYAVGAKLGRDTIRKLSGKRTARLSRRLADNGIIAVAIIRNLPVAPFTIVNMIAGASHIKLKDFLVGTAIGMLPGILGVVVFSDRLLNAVRNPGWFNVSIVAVVAVLIGIGSWWINRRLSKKTEKRS